MDSIKDVYQEALRLHKLSYVKTKTGYLSKNMYLQDASHLPKEIYDFKYLTSLNKKIRSFYSSENIVNGGGGKFKCNLTSKEALILLLKSNHDNINYMKELDIDLLNYKLGGIVFEINIKNVNKLFA